MVQRHAITEDGWLPQLAEILHRQAEEQSLPEAERYWSRFGWSQLEVPADCPLIAGEMHNLETMFNERYMFRMLGAETMEQWQVMLQSRFDIEVHRVERAMRMYAAHKDDMEGIGFSETHVETVSGSGTSESLSRQADTPDSAINLSASYGDSVSKSTGGTTNEGTRRLEVSRVEMSHAAEEVERSIRVWRDLRAEFIGRFENLFLNIFDY